MWERGLRTQLSVQFCYEIKTALKLRFINKIKSVNDIQ